MAALGDAKSVVNVGAHPHDCTDGFLQAYWRRPEAYLDAGVRSAISVFTGLSSLEDGLSKLRRDLHHGSWSRHNHAILDQTELDLGYRIITGENC